MSKCQVIILLSVSFFLILVTGLLLNPLQKDSLPEDTFWMNKIDMRAGYDIVLAGDSRVYCDLSPDIMKQVLSDTDIANYGFAGAGYEPQYLRAIHTLFSRKESAKVLVLGITPHSLTPAASEQNDFLYLSSIAPNDRWVRKNFGMLFHIVKPLDLSDIVYRMTGQKSYKLHEEFMPDGWVATDFIPPDPDIAYEYYPGLFVSNPVSPESIRRLLDEVRNSVSRGILVIGFRPPAGSRMAELEDRLGLFDEQAFTAGFSAAGGTWISVRQDDYETADGSHLRKESAIRFSRDLAAQIRDVLQQM